MAQMSVGSTNGDNGKPPGTRFVRAEIDEELRDLSHGVKDGAAASSDPRSRPTINGQPVQPSARPDIDPTARRRLKPHIRSVNRNANTDAPQDAPEATVKTIEEMTDEPEVEVPADPVPEPVRAPKADMHPEGHNPWEAAAEALRELARGDQAEDLLEAICFLEGRPLTELVEAVLRGYFSGRAGDEAVQAVVKARREYTPA